MKYIYMIIAFAGLIMTLLPSLMHYFGSLPEQSMKSYILVGTFLWFAGAIPWLGKKKKEA